jgi:hypothetical protein
VNTFLSLLFYNLVRKQYNNQELSTILEIEQLSTL